MEAIRVALPKGRLAEDAAALLQKAGMDMSGLVDDSRKLILTSGGMEFFLVKPADVPAYVEHGVADIGVCGKDTLMESDTNLYEVLDLGFGKCKLSICGFPGEKPVRAGLKVATKYPNIAQEYYREKGQSIEIIPLSGSVELGPLLKLSDVILDIVESGRTLKDNGLTVLQDICPISARLVVNRVSLKRKMQPIKDMIAAIQGVLEDKA